MCQEFGISFENRSAEDMYNDLTELILFKDYFPKQFRSIKKCGGVGNLILRAIFQVYDN